MKPRHPERLSLLVAAALVLGTLAMPASVDAAGAADAIISSQPADAPTVDLLIGARAGRGPEVATLTASFGARDKGAVRGLSVRRLRVPAAVAAKLARTLETDPSVGYVEVDAPVEMSLEPNDPYIKSVDEWGLPLIGAPVAWNTSTGAAGPIVAVIDTGVDATHPDLGGRVLPGLDLVNGDADSSDDNGHGTHVAGIIAAGGNNAIGGAGVCWGCRILPVKVLDGLGRGWSSDIASGITWAADHGAKIVNLSLGGSTSSMTLAAAVTYAQDRGTVVVAAAGNSGVTTHSYPAAIAGVVAVGASGSNGSLLAFSNHGTDWVDVAAGGCSVSTLPGGGYGSMCGTSMATPFVSGSIGLLLAADPSATAVEAVAAIELTAGPQSTDGTTHGLVHLDVAMATILADDPPIVAPIPPPPPAPAAAPIPPPAAAPFIFRRAVALARVPRSFVIVSRAGPARITLSNPKRSSLVVTVRRAGTVVWRRTTRARTINWTLNLRTARYSVTVARPGLRVAKGSISVSYHRR